MSQKSNDAAATTDDNTMANNNNAMAPTPSAVAPAIVYPPADLSGLTVAMRRAIQSVMSLGPAGGCMTVQGFPKNPGLVVASCQGTGASQFIFDGNGHISYPSRQTTVGSTTYAKGAYCLGVGLPGKPNVGQPVFMPCNSGDRNQIWGQAGSVLVSMPGKTCLGSDPTSPNPNAIVLQACTTRPQNTWALAL